MNRAYHGTCVLVPETWKNLDPMLLVQLFDLENCPNAQSKRLRYQYADHCTTFARSLAWFTEWPRSGAQLDNFVGDGGYQPLDASHTCHQNSCIVHITFDPAHINHDRKACCHLARRLRSEGGEILKHCDVHSPPCLMQLSRINRSTWGN